MPLPVVDQAMRVTLQAHETTSIEPILNTMDVTFIVEGGAVRADTLDEIAGAVRDAWQTHIVGVLPLGYSFEGVKWVSLDAEDNGSHGELVANPALDVVGEAIGEQTPPNTALLVQKNTNLLTAGQKPGRLFLAPVLESQVNGQGTVSAGTVTAINAAFEAFRTAAVLDTANFTVTPAVIHKVALDTYAANAITSFACQPLAATQRRRMR